jgi:ferredoxin-nitrite reductase/sulfite reductase (ferredoxin)
MAEMTGEYRDEIDGLSEAISAFLSGAMDPEDFRRRRLIYGIYPVRGAADRYLIRVRLPLGRPTPTHLLALADTAERFTPTRAVHLTTRQDVHIYGIEILRIPEALTLLAEKGLTTREACGDTVRNIVVCPHAGIARDDVFDVTPYAKALGTWLLRNPLGQRLPRKFKIAFEGCAGDDHVDLGVHDVGARAVIGPGGRPGFRISLAGGLGALPRAGIELEPFTPVPDLAPTVEAVLRLFDRLGDRQKRGRARLKFVSEKMGADAFREAVRTERRGVIATASGARLHLPGAIAASIDPSMDAADGFLDWPGAWRQRQQGLVALPVRVPLGDATAGQMRQLAGLVEEAGAEIRLTPAQGIVLANLAEERVGDVAARLRPAGFFPPASVALTRCAGTDTCTVGTTRVRALAALLESELSSLISSAGAADITVKISGCANGCGHHLLADIGLQGVAGNAGGRLAPLYTIFLGGGIRQGGEVRLGAPIGRIPVRRVPEALRRVIRLVRAERRDGERPGEAIERMGNALFAGRLKDLIDPSAPAFMEEDFFDLGSPEPFPPSRTDPKAP